MEWKSLGILELLKIMQFLPDINTTFYPREYGSHSNNPIKFYLKLVLKFGKYHGNFPKRKSRNQSLFAQAVFSFIGKWASVVFYFVPRLREGNVFVVFVYRYWCLSLCVPVWTVTIDIENSFWYCGTSRVLRSLGQGQGHTVDNDNNVT